MTETTSQQAMLTENCIYFDSFSSRISTDQNRDRKKNRSVRDAGTHNVQLLRTHYILCVNS